MGLKQSIIVKNEFTHNGVNTPGKGSRGGSPGQYVLRYMARIEATETLTPVALEDGQSVFEYTTRYMARESATERLKLKQSPYPSIQELKSEFREQDGLTGRAFGRFGISLSDEAVRESSARIQDAFDQGHAVQKVILSFDEDFLKDNGIVDRQFEPKGRGSYKGKIDQLKLRQAVTNGVEKMTKAGNYANPEWVGVIQVDTSHVHTHLAIVDTEFSPSRMVGDKHDKGKLTQREMMHLRRGIQSGLNEMKVMKSFHQHVSLERQNVVGYVKDYAYNHANQSSQLQTIIAALPAEKRLWRHGTNRKEMKRANELTEQYVKNIFDDQPVRSGYRDAKRAIHDYANERLTTEGLSRKEHTQLLKNGEDLLLERSVNGVYKSLNGLDKSKLPVRTPMMDIQSSSDDDLISRVASQGEIPTDGFDHAGFELRVRGYNERRNFHETQSVEYKQLMDVFDAANDQNQVALDAFMLRRFYEEELEWNMGLSDKYRSAFILNDRQDRQNVAKHMPEFEELTRRYQTIQQADAFLEAVDNGTALDDLDGIDSIDEAFKQPNVVNTYFEDVYGVKQGVRAFSELYRDGINDEVYEQKASYTTDLKNYTFNCFKDGVATQKDWKRLQVNHRQIDEQGYQEQVSNKASVVEPPTPPRVRSEGITVEHYDNVKALDIHHLGVDFYGKEDRTIATRFRESFAEAMKWREYFVQQARDFLNKTRQRVRATALHDIEEDIDDMRVCVDEMSQNGLIPTIDPIQQSDGEERNSQTIRIDSGVDVLPTVSHELESIRPEELDKRDRQIVAVAETELDGPGS